MAKIFSWKISDNLYGYIVPVNGNSYLTSTRIDSKDTPQLYNYIVETVTAFDYTTAKAGFDAMNVELGTKYGTEVDESLFQWDSTIGTKAIILTGKDGQNGRGGSGGSGSGSSGTIPDEVLKEFEEYIDRQLNAAQERIKKINEEVKKYLEEATAKDVQEAITELEKAKQRLEEIEADAKNSLEEAKNALDAARELFSGSGGTITAESIQDVMDKTNVVGAWLDDNKDHISGMTFDYDEATKILAGGYTASTVGAFSTLATGINTVSGTVGSVREDVDYCKGEIIKTGSYVDTISGTVTEVQRGMSALEGQIKDMVTYSDLSGKVTTEVIREMDAREGKIIDKASAKSSSAVTEVRREMNAMSGYITDKIFVEMSGNITTMHDTMDAIKGTAERALTRANDAMSSAVTLRDDWNVASGMVRSVADLVAETDAEGKIIYKYQQGEEHSPDDPRVYRDDKTGEFYKDKDLKIPVDDKTKVYVNYNTTMGSYIKQTSSSMTLSVINDKTKMGPAISMCIDDEGTGIIDIISHKVNIDAEVVMRQLETKYGNIGGTVMHNGLIYSAKKNDGTSSSATSENSTFIINGVDGSIKANNAIIKGGTIGGITIENNFIHSSNNKFSVNNDGELIAQKAQINGGITAQTDEKISIMDGSTFKISGFGASVSIEILAEWSGLTNVPVLCMDFGEERYVLSPGAWQKAGSEFRPVAKWDAIRISMSNSGKTETQARSEIGVLSACSASHSNTWPTTSDFDKAMKYINDNTVTIYRLSRYSIETEVPSELQPYLGKYYIVTPTSNTVYENTVAETIDKIKNKKANCLYVNTGMSHMDSKTLGQWPSMYDANNPYKSPICGAASERGTAGGGWKIDLDDFLNIGSGSVSTITDGVLTVNFEYGYVYINGYYKTTISDTVLDEWYYGNKNAYIAKNHYMD